MREVVLDTETTGLDPASGDRIVEIGCIELFDHVPTGREFQKYVNPERGMPEQAFAVHGLSADFLSGQPVFAEIAEEFLAFLGTAPLVIHNAEFDLNFINAELAACEKPGIPGNRVIDTLLLARRRFPGAPAALDALCNRFGIDNAGREKHGALLDSRLLAEVYLELIGGRQRGLGLSGDESGEAPAGAGAANGKGTPEREGGKSDAGAAPQAVPARPPRPHAPSDGERANHAAMLALLKNPIWTG